MKTLDLKQSVRLAVLPVACASLLSACASYERVVHRSTTEPAPAQVITAFDQLDTNRDGFLSKAEVQSLGIVVTGAAPPAESAVAMFQRLDTNRDGFLSKGEAGTTFNTIPGGSFDAFDTNKDGFLTLNEAMPHLQWLQNRSASGVFSFDALDINRDGLLSRSEAQPLISSLRMAGGRWVVVTTASSFDRLDIDRDGFLTRSEAAPFINSATFDRYDTNRDGFLSRSEADPLFRSNVGGTDGTYGGTVYGPR
jgi:Ca2+-binding EF-hand superfamily protein